MPESGKSREVEILYRRNARIYWAKNPGSLAAAST